MCVIYKTQKRLWKNQEHKGLWVFALLAENYGRNDTEEETFGFMFLSKQLFIIVPSNFLHNSKQCPVSTATNRWGCRCARACMLAKQMWVCEPSKECVLRNQGESFLVSVPAIVPSPWKSMPVVGRQSPLSCVCLQWWKKHPPTDSPSGCITHQKNAYLLEHINSPTGCQSELHFARRLLSV